MRRLIRDWKNKEPSNQATPNVPTNQPSSSNALPQPTSSTRTEEPTQPAAHGQEGRLGLDDQNNFNVKLRLGRTIYKQGGRREDAEVIFRELLHDWEAKLGGDHRDIVYTKYWLGVLCCMDGKYDEATDLLRQILPKDDGNPNGGKAKLYDTQYWLGRALVEQKSYKEAKKVLRSAVTEWEETLGENHRYTCRSKQWLGRALYELKRYTEAEQVFLQARQACMETFGPQSIPVATCTGWLGRTFHRLKQFDQAETCLREASIMWTELAGKEDVDTLSTNEWIARTLHKQNKYVEAEAKLREVIHGWKMVRGEDDELTIESEDLLARILYDQEKYREAEELCNHILHKRKKLSKGIDRSSSGNMQPSSSAASETKLSKQQSAADRLNLLFPEQQDHRTSYTDSEIHEISTLLGQQDSRWGKVPRTYIILRIIGHLNLLDELISLGFSDYWLPVTERSLPASLRSDVRTSFVRTQELVLTQSMDLERGERGRHCVFQQQEALPLESKGMLGSGGFGQVDRVLSLISFREYARKRILRSVAFRGQRDGDRNQLIAEIEILKRLNHRHVVDLVGSYTDAQFIGLIMSPVAEMDLAAYMARADAPSYSELRSFFGCLARALEYLHKSKIRHKDIKPSNILVDHGTVLFADFGLSLDFDDASGSTTVGMVNGRTPRYCAPEVALLESRNTSSDIWSLGVVFMEMGVILKGKTVQDMDDFLRRHGSSEVFIRTNISAVPELIAELEGTGEEVDNRVFGWSQQMLSVEQKDRPTASGLVASIISSSTRGEGTVFCGTCCNLTENDFC